MPEGPPTKEELEIVEKAMQQEAVSHAGGILLAAWRLYWLARAQMIAVSKGLLHDGNFPIASQALAKAAMNSFKVGKLKNQMKTTVMPFLKHLSIKEARMSEAKHGSKPDPDPNPEAAGGDEETCHP